MTHSLSRRALLLSSGAALASAATGCSPGGSGRPTAAAAAALPPRPPRQAEPAHTTSAADAPAPSPRRDLSVLPPRIHQNDLRAFVVEPTGGVLATGSTTPDPNKDGDFYDKGGALVLFDVATGGLLVSASVAPGGVGWLGCPDGLLFSPQGDKLMMSWDTSAVAVLDLTGGRIARMAELRIASYRGWSAPAATAWLGADHVVLEAGDLFVARADVDAPTDKGPSVRSIPAPKDFFLASTRAAHSTVVGRVRAHGVGGRPDLAVGIDVSQGKVVFQTKLRGYAAPGDTLFSASPGGRRAVYGDPNVTIVLDAETGSVLAESKASLRPEHATWSRDEKRLALVTERSILVFEDGRPTATLARAPRELLWQELPDASPFAFSPDGERAVLLTRSGEIELLEGRGWTKRGWRKRETSGACGVLWPRPDTIVCLGLRAITFWDAETGSVRAQHRW